MPLSLFSKLLSRLPRAPRALRGSLTPAASGDLNARISKTLHDAFTAAGLMETPDARPQVLQPAPTAPPPAQPAPRERRPKPRLVGPAPGIAIKTPSAAAGSFTEHSFSNAFGTRSYKLYLPAGYVADADQRFPLIVMLHGCTQSPDDFARGTQMNTLADTHGFLVAYPAQSQNANGSRCWNWFRSGDQLRAAGEPAVLAGLTQQVIAEHAVDPARVYVAGLSAGAAMAVILGTTHPELFAAVGAHSGLPYRAARDVPSAFAAMGGTHALREVDAQADAQARQSAAPPSAVVPLIVFHGDADRTVAPSNGEALVRQMLGAASALPPESASSETAGGGRRYTRSVYTTSLGDPLVEYWQLHGAGHAWSGGSASGSYTDPQGPDASAEMVRFFQQVAMPEKGGA